MNARIVVLLVAGLVSACGGTPSDGGDGKLVPSHGSDAAAPWPSEEIGQAASCVYEYPEDLGDRPIAFDGTVVGQIHGSYDDDAGATPVELEVQVNETFRGTLDPVVTMHTWDFMLPDADVTGTRILAAAGETMDLMGCGFTRPYSAEEADRWRSVFQE